VKRTTRSAKADRTMFLLAATATAPATAAAANA
jgi:hypothetical protein